MITWLLNLLPQYRSTLATLADAFQKYQEAMAAAEHNKAQFEEALKVAHQNKSAFEALEKQFNEQGAQLVRAHDALESRNTEVGYLREQVSELQRQAIESTQTVANFHAQMLYGQKIFGAADGMPDDQVAAMRQTSIVSRGAGQKVRARQAHENEFRSAALQAFNETK